MSIVLVLALAFASEDPAALSQARSYFEAGKLAYESGKYAAAATAFRESNALAPRAATVFSMAQAHRLQYLIDRDPLNLKAAVDLYRNYLTSSEQLPRRNDTLEHLSTLEPMLLRVEEEQRRSGRLMEPVKTSPTQLMVSSQVAGARASIDGGALGEVPLIASVTPGAHTIHVEAPGYAPQDLSALAVDGRLIVVDAELVSLPARLHLEVAAGADISVGGRFLGEAPLATIELAPGRHFVSVSQTGRHLFQREVSVARGEELSLSVDLEVTTQRKIAYTFLGGSLLLAAGGIVSTVVAIGAEKDALAFDGQLNRGEVLEPEDVRVREHRTAKRDRWALISGALYGGAVAAAATGFLLYVLDEPRIEAPRSFEVAPLIGADTVGVGVTVRP